MKINKKTVVVVACFFIFIAQSWSQSDPLEQKIHGILKQMTLDEKIYLLHGCSEFEVGGIARLEIPKIKMTDGPQGVRGPVSTYNPTGIAIAATWDPNLVELLGESIGKETKASGAGVILGPGVNIMRTPLCGRNFEYYGEDPFLAGSIASSYIKGVQKQGVAACVKHMALNNQEKWRTTNSSQIDERSLHEIYLPAFKMACDSGVWSIMSSYNKINGEYASANRYLQYDITKMLWNWDGTIMSDWGAVHNTWAAAMGGLDLEMPGGSDDDYMGKPLLEMVKEGRIPEPVIDEKVLRVLRLIYRISDNPMYKVPAKANTKDNVAIARKVAEESIVLLKNENNFLPLSDKVKTIAVIGPSANFKHAMHGVYGSGGSGAVNPPYEITPLQAIRERFGNKAKIIYVEGISYSKELSEVPAENLSSKGKSGLQAVYYNNANFEGKPVLARTDKSINFYFGSQVANTDGVPQGLMSVRWTGVLKPTVSGLYKLGTKSDDGSRIYINNNVFVDNWGDHAAEVVTKEIKLEEGKEYAIKIEYANTGGIGSVKLLWELQKSEEEDCKTAQEAAAKADIVLYFGGLDHSYDKEAIGWGDVSGADRPNYDLIGNQNDFIKKLAQTNPNIVVTLFGGGPMNVEPFIDQIKGLLMAWYPGQEGGRAITDILFGNVNPSGKLNCTWAKALKDYACHALNAYPGTGNYGIVNYDEGMFVGYRWFDTKKIEPRFPFGYGLSYTQFNVSDVSVENKSVDNIIKVIVRCKVKNNGKKDGSEVVQVYNGLSQAKYVRPEKELRAFEKVFLKSGEEKQIEFELGKTAFSAYYVSENSKWKLVKGNSPIYVGTSAQNIVYKTVVEIK